MTKFRQKQSCQKASAAYW